MSLVGATKVRSGFVLALFACIACGDGDEGDDDNASSVTLPHTGTADSSSATDPSTTAPDGDTTMDPTAADSSSGPVDPTAATDTTGPGDEGACVPPMASFLIEPPARGQAAITFDFGAMTCAAISLSGDAPQLVLDIQESGLINATGFGIEITDSSHGLLFGEPPVGDSLVIDLMPDIEFTMVATAVEGGQPVTIVFTIFSQGPVLIDVSAVFG